MKRLKIKFLQSTGASISFALAFFLVAAMVCSTIVAASVTAVKRTNDEKERMQAQLTLESCAKQLEKGLRNTTGTITATRVVTTTGAEKSKTVDASAAGDMAGVASRALNAVKGGGSFSGDMKILLSGDSAAASAAVQEMYLKPVDPSDAAITVAYTMQPESEPAGEGEVNTSYQMVFTLKLKNASKTKEYTALLNATAVTTEASEESSTAEEKTSIRRKTIQWKNYEVTSY